MALAHLGVDFERIPTRFVDIADVENGACNTVPVIRHGEQVVTDSFDIGLHLRRSYPDNPRKLFEGIGATRLCRFIEAWALASVHPFVGRWAMLDIHNMLEPQSAIYFRDSRQHRIGTTLEAYVADREEQVEGFLAGLAPLRQTVQRQPFIGGDSPRFADYLVFSRFQWLRVASGLSMMPKDDPVAEWIERCLDLHGALARSVPEGGA